MFESLFGAQMPLAVRFFLAFLVVLAVSIGLIFLVALAFKTRRTKPPPPVQIASIIELGAGSSSAVGLAAVLLVISSLASGFVYLNATTVFQEIVALLMWIGSDVFWGVIMIVSAVGRERTYIVYRDVASTERQEPNF